MRGRRRLAGAASVTLVATVAVAIGLLAPAAGAGPIVDAEPLASELVVERIEVLDTAIRVDAAGLPEAERAVAVAAAALDAARAEEQRALQASSSAIPTHSESVVDAATNAILGDLAPERATQARTAAERASFFAVQQRDAFRDGWAAALAERSALLASLDAHGQVRTRWSIALLDALSAPVTRESIRGLAAWIGAEAHDAHAHNPLATTMSAPGSTVVNDHGVRAYQSDLVGIDATVRTLRNGLYGGILAALEAGDSAPRLVAAVAASPWGTGENAVRRLQLDSR
jgi:hypothetical protein